MPAGADQQVQFNAAGAFGADADFAWDSATKTLTTGALRLTRSLITQGFVVIVPTENGNHNVPADVTHVLLDHSTNLNTCTFTLPASPPPGTTITFATARASIAALTFPGVEILAGTPTSMPKTPGWFTLMFVKDDFLPQWWRIH